MKMVIERHFISAAVVAKKPKACFTQLSRTFQATKEKQRCGRGAEIAW